MTPDFQIDLWKKMYFLRAVEMRVAREYPKGEMRCPTHLSVGQELTPALLSFFLTHDDYAVSTHRGHVHYLSKGGCLQKMIAELFGRVTGCSKGFGGSMHLADAKVRFMGTSAIVGNSIPVGAGLALKQKIASEEGITVVYFGDGATEEGVFYETLNFCAVRCLPVLFVCENNLYSVYSGLKDRRPDSVALHSLVAGMGVQSHYCEAGDIQGAHGALCKIFSKMRDPQTCAPVFLEIDTYRFLEHCGPSNDDDLGYRSKAEVSEFRAIDPLDRLSKTIDMTDELAIYKAEVERELEQAFEFARSSDYPSEADIKFKA
jgi:TPP-dependent pyruvate/acetoin dehydrogenase alpha subunit